MAVRPVPGTNCWWHPSQNVGCRSFSSEASAHVLWSVDQSWGADSSAPLPPAWSDCVTSWQPMHVTPRFCAKEKSPVRAPTGFVAPHAEAGDSATVDDALLGAVAGEHHRVLAGVGVDARAPGGVLGLVAVAAVLGVPRRVQRARVLPRPRGLRGQVARDDRRQAPRHRDRIARRSTRVDGRPAVPADGHEAPLLGDRDEDVVRIERRGGAYGGRRGREVVGEAGVPDSARRWTGRPADGPRRGAGWRTRSRRGGTRAGHPVVAGRRRGCPSPGWRGRRA